MNINRINNQLNFKRKTIQGKKKKYRNPIKRDKSINIDIIVECKQINELIPRNENLSFTIIKRKLNYQKKNLLKKKRIRFSTLNIKYSMYLKQQ